MIRIQDIQDKVSAYHPEADLDLINRAYVYSARIHEGKTRLSGEPYLSHPLEVAGILADMKLDVTSIAAGLLHDVVENTHASLNEIREMFGPQMAHLVSGVTQISGLSFGSLQERQAESIRKMIMAMADDIRVILIKLADRLHNMRDIQFHLIEQQAALAQETLDIYAPIASRLGIYWIKKELEDLSFVFLFPEKYQEIDHLLKKTKDEREKQIAKVKDLLQKEMQKAGIEATVKGRHKHYYSIYSKMQRQQLAFEDVYDIIAFRVIVDAVPRCYEVLGIVHNLWKPIAKKFKDYIGQPKPNMYQSLHTTVIGPFGERVEIQIRTREMDDTAESGIAAHWSYKEGRTADDKTRKAIAWVQDIVESQKNVKDPDEFLENVRIELFPDEVYVFTPQGDVIALPKGATPVDFAYAVHSQVGNRCFGAKVNGRMVPLRSEIRTGDRVEILTGKNHQPSKDWLNFVRTVKAKSRIRQWIKTQERERSIALGREMCEKTFHRARLNLSRIIKNGELQEVLAQLGFASADDLMAAVGYGKVTPLAVLRRFLPEEKRKEVSLPDKPPEKKRSETGVVVHGVDDILIRFAKCCNPVPGDPIVGYITRGHGVTVHLKNCVNAQKTDPERAIEVEWDQNLAQSYPVRLYVLAVDRVGLLADITGVFTQCNANILSANTHSAKEDRMAEAYFTITVSGKKDLDRLIQALRKISNVQEVRRLTR